MKKIFVTIFTGASLALALNSCNNAAEVQKQKDADAAAVQAAVDAKLNSLQGDAAAWCDSVVLATATPIADSLIAADAKAAGKPAPKPKPKPKPPVETKKDDKGTVTDRKSTTTTTQDNKVTDRKSTETQSQQNKVTDRKSKQNPQ
ncbi:MAG: hypothetical protein U0T75_06515 [Chitinophagales bacterium]